MSYETRAYDNDAGDPVVVMVVTGVHDVSRLVNLLVGGNCEQGELGRKLLGQVRRHNGGRMSLALLARHGGPDFTGESHAEARAAVAETIYLRHAHGWHAVMHEIIEPPCWNRPGAGATEPLTPDQAAWIRGEPVPTEANERDSVRPSDLIERVPDFVPDRKPEWRKPETDRGDR